METWKITNKGYSKYYSFHSSKSGSFNRLRGNFYYDIGTLNLIEEEIQCQNKVLFFTFFR